MLTRFKLACIFDCLRSATGLIFLGVIRHGWKINILFHQNLLSNFCFVIDPVFVEELGVHQNHHKYSSDSQTHSTVFEQVMLKRRQMLLVQRMPTFFRVLSLCISLISFLFGRIFRKFLFSLVTSLRKN